MLRVLVVEDDEDSRTFLETFLRGSGYAVDSAVHGGLGLASAKKSRPDLIISDILMPEMDGYALCRALKADAELCGIPFIFYTATYTNQADKKLALDLGAARFLVKPLDMDELLAEIEGVMVESSNIVAVCPSEEDPEKIDQKYIAVLSHKLDKKVRDLEVEHGKFTESEQRYKRLIETIGGEYFFYSRDFRGGVVYVSPSVRDVLGYLPKEFEEPTNEEIKHFIKSDTEPPKRTLPLESGHLNSADGNKPSSYEVEMCHRDGSIRCLEVTEYPVTAKSGEVIGIEGIVHDVTVRYEADKEKEVLAQQLRQAQKMEAIGTLSGGIAHDFNNILTPIIGYTEMTIYNLPEGSENRQNLEEVLCAAGRAKSLVKQILTFSRQATQERTPVQLYSIIKEILKLLRSSIPTTIEIKEDVGSQCGPVLANQTQIHQLLMNLCTNASQAMRENGGVLAVSLKELELAADDYLTNFDLSPGRYIRLEVSDTGGGIDPTLKERVFDPYFTTKKKDEGTGLGLSVVLGIVKSHGGHITLYSELGKGATFHVYFPKIQFSTDIVSKVDKADIPGGTERVMVVDDEPVIAKMIAEMLDRLGYQTTIMVSAHDALHEFRNSPAAFDLLITDMTMPVMTGAELAKEIMAIRPEMPVILCSGFSELINKEKAEALGVREYLMKPVSINDLARSVRLGLDVDKI